MTIASPPDCVLTDAVSGNATVVDGQTCVAAGLVPPAVSLPCNRFQCPSLRTLWWVGPWSQCYSVTAVNDSVLVAIDVDVPTGGGTTAPSPLLCGSGRQWRTVACRSSSNTSSSSSGGTTTTTGAVTVADSRCAGERPQELTSCHVASCGCAVDADCASSSSTTGHHVCNTTADGDSSGGGGGVCACAAGWAGVECDIALLQSANGDDCDDGVVDLSGQCCRDDAAIDADSGLCCGAGVAVDGSGRCCALGQGVDACGVCGGDGLGLDVNGVCCDTVIAPSGECCVTGTLDSCGVCSGTSGCDADVSVVTQGSAPVAIAANFWSLLALSMNVPLSALVNTSAATAGTTSVGFTLGGQVRAAAAAAAPVYACARCAYARCVYCVLAWVWVHSCSCVWLWSCVAVSARTHVCVFV